MTNKASGAEGEVKLRVPVLAKVPIVVKAPVRILNHLHRTLFEVILFMFTLKLVPPISSTPSKMGQRAM